MPYEIVSCPFCGEPTDIDVDLAGEPEPGADPEDELSVGAPGTHVFTQDCEVCCNPIRVRVVVSADGGVSLDVERE